jgi:photosystem II stability/assembly factor-like uncharacterized protein
MRRTFVLDQIRIAVNRIRRCALGPERPMVRSSLLRRWMGVLNLAPLLLLGLIPSETAVAQERLYGISDSWHGVANSAWRGIAVGSSGRIMSLDDGQTQAFQSVPGINADLFDVVFLADGMRGWIAGSGGTILSSNNGGMNWRRQPTISDVANVTLYSVGFAPDGTHGWAVGEAGKIIATADGGANWSSQNSGVTTSLSKVRASSDGKQIWAAGIDGVILTTTNGTDWHPQTSGTHAWLFDIFIANDG